VSTERLLGGLAVAALCLAAVTAGAHEAAPARANFVPPAPGTYHLERIMQAPEGAVLDTNRKRAKLSGFTQGKVTVLSLMYTSCSDEKGCPMAFYSLQLVQRELAKAKPAQGRVRLVSLSFDPEHDTPEVMRTYGGKHVGAKTGVPWHFLTTASKNDLRPVLDGLGQDVSKPSAPEEQDKASNLSHVLKVYLVDRDGWVREIYSTAFLIPQVVVNDVKTLLLEEGVKLD
jgi:cytochrome oxidase Cu insertion factor (SCO1/SenC/PrrC family)